MNSLRGAPRSLRGVYARDRRLDASSFRSSTHAPRDSQNPLDRRSDDPADARQRPARGQRRVDDQLQIPRARTRTCSARTTSANNSYFKPAIQGGLDYAFGDSGFYVGNWNSSVNWLKGNAIEMRLYGGYKFTGRPDRLGRRCADLCLPRQHRRQHDRDLRRRHLGQRVLRRLHGQVLLDRVQDYFNYAGNQGGSGLDGTNTGYLNLAYTKEIIPKVTLKAAVGYTFFSSDILWSLGYEDYVDFNGGAAYDFGSGLSLGGYVQGGNEQSAFNAVVSPGIPSPIGPIGQTTSSPNATRFILILTKTL